MEQCIPIDGCPQTGRLALMRNWKMRLHSRIILYTSTLFSFIRSLSFLNLSVVLTVSISAARFVEIDSCFFKNLLVREGCKLFLIMNLNWYCVRQRSIDVKRSGRWIDGLLTIYRRACSRTALTIHGNVWWTLISANQWFHLRIFILRFMELVRPWRISK